jgi:hypothetical protein
LGIPSSDNFINVFPRILKHILNKDFTTYTFDVLVSSKALFLELLKKLDESIDEKVNIPPGLLINFKNVIVPGGYNKWKIRLNIHSSLHSLLQFFEYLFPGLGDRSISLIDLITVGLLS